MVNISKRYDSPSGSAGEYVLKDINLQLDKGKSLAIIGPSGSGKSTILNIIGTLDRPTTGEVFLNGKELTGRPDNELARIRNNEIGFVFQLHHLLPQCTALENVLVPTLASAQGKHTGPLKKRARELLNLVGLGHRLDYRPGQLSGGERQRVAVVRALINNPELLLADEPTGALDKSASDILVDLLGKVNREQGTTIIMVTHAPTLAQRMERVLVLENGTLNPADMK